MRRFVSDECHLSERLHTGIQRFLQQMRQMHQDLPRRCTLKGGLSMVAKYECDVVVVGAGPGGSMAARYAAEGGAKTILIEKKAEIGAPLRCAEGVSKKAGYVKIDTEDYLNLLSDRAKEIGRQIPMEEEFFNYIRDFGEDTDFGSPSYVVDNYCINGEFVERETGFTADGDYSNKFKEYNGDWNEFCSNEAVFYNEEEACLNLGL